MMRPNRTNYWVSTSCRDRKSRVDPDCHHDWDRKLQCIGMRSLFVCRKCGSFGLGHAGPPSFIKEAVVDLDRLEARLDASWCWIHVFGEWHDSGEAALPIDDEQDLIMALAIEEAAELSHVPLYELFVH